MRRSEAAKLFARETVDHAMDCGSGIIAFEDLTSLEAGGLGRRNNTRISQSVRRKTLDSTSHAAAREGICVVTVPPRGTSAQCPGCDGAVLRPRGYPSASCPSCGLDSHRDTVGAVNIAKRALLGKVTIRRKRGVSHRVVPAVKHAPVSRDKRGPTPKQRRHRRVRHSLPDHLINSNSTCAPASARGTAKRTSVRTCVLTPRVHSEGTEHSVFPSERVS